LRIRPLERKITSFSDKDPDENNLSSRIRIRNYPPGRIRIRNSFGSATLVITVARLSGPDPCGSVLKWLPWIRILIGNTDPDPDEG